MWGKYRRQAQDHELIRLCRELDRSEVNKILRSPARRNRRWWWFDQTWLSPILLPKFERLPLFTWRAKPLARQVRDVAVLGFTLVLFFQCWQWGYFKTGMDNSIHISPLAGIAYLIATVFLSGFVPVVMTKGILKRLDLAFRLMMA